MEGFNSWISSMHAIRNQTEQNLSGYRRIKHSTLYAGQPSLYTQLMSPLPSPKGYAWHSTGSSPIY